MLRVQSCLNSWFQCMGAAHSLKRTLAIHADITQASRSSHQLSSILKPPRTLCSLSTFNSQTSRGVSLNSISQKPALQRSLSCTPCIFHHRVTSSFSVPLLRTFSSLCRSPVLLKHSKQQKTCMVYFLRHMNNEDSRENNTNTLIYIIAMFIFMVGMGYASVPLYRMFCQATGLGGQAIMKEEEIAKVEGMTPVKNRLIRIRFNADTASSMQWNFRPQQSEIWLQPGETALAFYTAKNPTDKPIIGISTYNVIPFDAGQYFNKIQCFCFEEQRLNPHEQVDMPVFFYIDPEFADDPKLENADTITLSYTFFEAKEGMSLPLPGFMTARQ